jgi:hypothetical protein
VLISYTCLTLEKKLYPNPRFRNTEREGGMGFRSPVVTTRVFGEENPTPCTLVIVPGSVAITYRTHYSIISVDG